MLLNVDMPKSELEIIKYPKIKHIKMLVNKIQSVEDHIHNDFEFFLILKGKGKAKIDSRTFDLSEGDIFFINSGDVHSYSSLMANNKNAINDGPVVPPTFLFVQISNHYIRDYFPQIRTTIFKSGSLKEVLSEEEYRSVVAGLVDAGIAYFSEHTYYQLDIMADISKALALTYKRLEHEIINEGQKQKVKRKNARLERIISYIDANFDTQIRLEDLANMENLSVTHFSHLFSSSFGVTFQEFVNLKRMEQCIRLMSNTEKTLLEISYESGFSDSKYMNKMFLKKFGCTPKEYRKNMDLHSKEYEVQIGKFETIFNDSMSLKYLEDFKTQKIDNK